MRDPETSNYWHFTSPMRLQKALQSFRGLIEGVLADGVVNVRESTMLKKWISDPGHADLTNRHPIKDIVHAITPSFLEDRYNEEELQDALWLCERFDATNAQFDLITLQIQELHGILGGIASDGIINVLELAALREWMEDRDHLKSCWPYTEVDAILMHALADGCLDKQEHELLLAFFASFTVRPDYRSIDLPLNEVGHPITGVCAACPEITFDGKLFCFTGTSERWVRSKLASLVLKLGGRFKENLVQDTDYLVIGAAGNPAWAYACYGRKVEKAIRFRRDGSHVLIVHENDFWDAVQDSGYDQ